MGATLWDNRPPANREYGKVSSLRVWYLGSHEVEYGFTDETWSAWPVDDGTRKVISDGMQILWERGGI